MNTHPIRIACIGEAMVELSFPTGGLNRPEIGYSGDALNTAIYLKRAIGNIGEVAFVTALGTDRFSDQMLAFFNREGLQTDLITRNPDRQPGLYTIMTDTDGERSFNYWRENSAARLLFQAPDGADFSALSGFDIIYFSAITLAILPDRVRQALLDWLAGVQARGECRIAFDSNYRPGLWQSPAQAREWVQKAWRITDIALPSLDDELALFNDTGPAAALTRLQGYGLQEGALKNGALGPIPLSQISDLPEFPPATKVVDTTAAGDSFNGAFLAAYLSGQGPSDAMLAGHQCAAQVVGFAGAFEKPTL